MLDCEHRISCLLTARLLLQIREVQAKASSGVGESLSTFDAGEESTFIAASRTAVLGEETTRGTIGTMSMGLGLRFSVDATILDDFGDDDLVTGLMADYDEAHADGEGMGEVKGDIELQTKPDQNDARQLSLRSQNSNGQPPSARPSLHQASLRDEEAMIEGTR